MNPIDDQLNRLFRAAKEADPAVGAPPYGWDTRMMASWRAGRTVDAGLWDMALLVRALVVAIILMGISFWPVLNKTSDPYSDYLQLADSTLSSDETP
jgi:hypothetical protein